MKMDISSFAEVAFYLWLFSEIGILIVSKRQRKSVDAENKDKGSFWMITIGICACVFVNQVCNSMKLGYVDSTFSSVGSVLMIVGVAIRLWAVAVLGRHFSLVVSVDSKQKLIQRGPYRVLRHPSYTGLFLAFAGMGLAFNTWVGSLIMLVFFIAVFSYRIRVEEKALSENFPDEYPGYIQKTSRIIPFVW